MKVVVTEKTHEAARKLLAEAAEVVILEDFTEPQLLAALQDADAVIIRAKANLHGELLKKCAHLKCVAKAGAGLDNIDTETAKNLGIKVISAPGLNANAVAEHAIMLGLAVWRRTVANDHGTRGGRWWELRKPELVEAAGKNLGIVGYGAIGRRVAEIGRALRMSVWAYDVVFTDEREKDGTRFASFEEVLKNADLLTLHVPLSKTTFHLLGRKELGMMKPSAILVNTSRGAVVDEQALVESLRSGKLFGAGLDVFEKEPPDPNNPLFDLETVIVSPHAAALTEECFRSAAVYVAREVLKTLKELPTLP